MAVVQISKIQIRRGLKNSNTGVPQLSSAEFAWAVDSQELFIGNGSVSEGAPYVGNTKIITEHDNILALASGYQFAENNSAITASVSRSLQSKLDETVSVLDFGAVGDGSTDNTAAFQTALNQLFRNSNTAFQKVLLVPNGTYYFSPAVTPLTIPPNAIIRGETKLGAVLNINSANIYTETATGLLVGSFNSTNRPQNINISNLTVQRTTGSIVFTGVANSTFDSVLFAGNYTLGTAVSSLDTEPAAIYWSNTLVGTAVDQIKFVNCSWSAVSVGVHCSQTAAFETRVIFDTCDFLNLDTGIYISGVTEQQNSWEIKDCHFEQVANNVFRSTHGKGTLISRTRFKNCGSGTNTSAYPSNYIVYFGDKDKNVIYDCLSDRQTAAGITSSASTYYIPEVWQGSNVKFIERNYSLVYLSDSARPVAVFSAYVNFLVLNYKLKLSTYERTGTMTVCIDDGQTAATLTDNYTYSPLTQASPGGSIMTGFTFSVALAKNNSSSAGNDTLVLSYVNPLASGATGAVTFDVAYGL